MLRGRTSYFNSASVHRPTSYLNSASVTPAKQPPITGRGTPLTHYIYSLSARRYTLFAAKRFLSKVRWRVHYRTLMGFSGVSEAGFSGVTELLTRLKGKIPVQFSAKMERDPVSKQFPELDPFHKLG
ncbi:hypothetical protein GW17_00054394 [Ensete ventricosum]|nr:hypothetical protein GW17_00054394 [Ensete ventricosum]